MLFVREFEGKKSENCERGERARDERGKTERAVSMHAINE
jgi:hypothetical protein